MRSLFLLLAQPHLTPGVCDAPLLSAFFHFCILVLFRDLGVTQCFRLLLALLTLPCHAVTSVQQTSSPVST